MDFKYFKDHYNLAACNLSQQKQLDANPRSLQEVEFNCMLNTNSQICTVLENSKETVLEFYQENVKVLRVIIND